MNKRQFKATLKILELTQAQTAKKLGVTPRTISTIVNSDNVPMLYVYALKGLLSECKGYNLRVMS